MFAAITARCRWCCRRGSADDLAAGESWLPTSLRLRFGRGGAFRASLIRASIGYIIHWFVLGISAFDSVSAAEYPAHDPGPQSDHHLVGQFASMLRGGGNCRWASISRTARSLRLWAGMLLSCRALSSYGIFSGRLTPTEAVRQPLIVTFQSSGFIPRHPQLGRIFPKDVLISSAR